MKNVKVAVIVLGFIGAGLVFYFNMNKKEEIPEAVNKEKTLWMCAACQKTQEWTMAQESEYSHSAAPPLPCPACKERKLYRAIKCPECGTVYFGADVPDSSGKCPKCFPDAPKVAPPPVDEEKPEATDQPEDNSGPAKRPKLRPI